MRLIPGISLHWPGEMAQANIIATGGKRLVEQFRYQHVHVNGWLDIGYHYVVAPDAKGNYHTYDGRPDWMTGAHSGTNWGNQHLGINVCYGSDLQKVPDQALDETARLIAELSKTYGFTINAQTIRGHRDFIATQCPGTQLYASIPLLIRKAIQTKAEPRKPQEKPQGTEQRHEEQLLRIKANLAGQTVDAMLINSQSFISAKDLVKLGFKVGWDKDKRIVNVSR